MGVRKSYNIEANRTNVKICREQEDRIGLNPVYMNDLAVICIEPLPDVLELRRLFNIYVICEA